MRIRHAVPLVPLMSVLVVAGVIGIVDAFFARPFPSGCRQATATNLPQAATIATVNGQRVLKAVQPAMYAGRLTYSSAATLQVVAFLAGMIGGLALGLRLLRPMGIRGRILMLAATVLVGGWLAAIAVSPELTPVTTLLLQRTVAAECGQCGSMHLTLDRMTMTLAFFLTAVTGMALFVPHGSLAGRLRRMAEGQRAITAILLLSTIFLAASVFRISAIGRWIESYYAGDAVAAVHVIFDAVVQTWGVYYSLMLASVYVPAALILRYRIAHAARALSVETAPDWLDPTWLKPSYTEEATRIIAVLAPFLAGQAADLLKAR